jgi:hypothetical protein
MAKILGAMFLMSLKAENDARVRTENFQKLGTGIQEKVIAFATRGKRIVYYDGTPQFHPDKFSAFLKENNVIKVLKTDYFDETVSIEHKKLVYNPRAWVENQQPWVEPESLPITHYLRGIQQDILEITW